MNSYSHELYHNNHAREQEANAMQYRLAYQGRKNIQPAYKKLVANIGKTLVRVGATLQDFTEL